MNEWAMVLKEGLIEWLLEETNPSVQYFTLCDILDKDENDSQVVAAKEAISKSQVINKILQKQKPGGYWEEPENPYHPKYKSSYWQIMTLGQLGIDRSNERAKKACEHIFSIPIGRRRFFISYSNDCFKRIQLAYKKGEETTLT